MTNRGANDDTVAGADSFETFDVALSYAGEDRAHAEAIAAGLKAHGIRVFYDVYEQGALWGRNLYEHLHEVYSGRARYCVMLLSRSYATKLWTNHERQAAQARAFQERGRAYILPVRIDDTSIPGMPETIGYVPISLGTDRIVALLLEKLASADTSAVVTVAQRRWVSPRVLAWATAATIAIAGVATMLWYSSGDSPSGPPPTAARAPEPVAADPPASTAREVGTPAPLPQASPLPAESPPRAKKPKQRPPAAAEVPRQTTGESEANRDPTEALKAFGEGQVNLIDGARNQIDRVLGDALQQADADRRAAETARTK
jgi:hypothetical protein